MAGAQPVRGARPAMPLLNFTSLSVGIASSTLLEDAEALLLEGERVGLVGQNGCGKSTLLRLLAHLGEDTAASANEPSSPYWSVTSGSIGGELGPSRRTPGVVLLVSQDVLSWSSLFPEAAASEGELRAMMLEEAMDAALAQGSDTAAEDEAAWRRMRVAADEALCWKLAGYEDAQLGQLSPGSALRAYLAIALHRPGVQLLLLDEPTNHLDLPSILWLQYSILKSGKTVMVVSHDEAFLDAVADRIWEIDAEGALNVSAARYSSYKRAKLLAIEKQKRDFGEQQKRHSRLTAVAGSLRAHSVSG